MKVIACIASWTLRDLCAFLNAHLGKMDRAKAHVKNKRWQAVTSIFAA